MPIEGAAAPSMVGYFPVVHRWAQFSKTMEKGKERTDEVKRWQEGKEARDEVER